VPVGVTFQPPVLAIAFALPTVILDKLLEPVPPEVIAKGVVKVTTPLAIVIAVPVPPTKAKVPDVSELITSEVAVVVPAVNIVAILGS